MRTGLASGVGGLVSTREAQTRGDGRTTVVVATRNRRDELLRTLERLASLPEEPPVVVVDNGSTDGTAAAVAARHPAVRLLALHRNHGACARNLGVGAARTPYVAFADDDSWWEPGALRTAADVLDRYPRLALLVGRIKLGDDGRTDPVSRKMSRGLLGREPDLPGPSVAGFPACAAVTRKDAFVSVGGFDPMIFFGGEESLLSVDLLTSGWGLAYVDTVVSCHVPSACRSMPADRWALHQRNDLLVRWMRLSPAGAARATWRLSRRATRDRAARAALCGLLRRLPYGLARRRRVPRFVERRLQVLGELR